MDNEKYEETRVDSAGETYIPQDDGTRLYTKDIVPRKKIFFPALSGRSKRKLHRMNTVHLDGFCPNCEKRVRYRKEYRLNRDTVLHDIWHCNSCGKNFKRKDFTYVKYNHI